MGLTLANKWETFDEETRRELLDRMNMNAHRLAQRINSLLDFSRIESGSGADLQPVGLRAVIDDCVARLSGILAGHDVCVSADASLRVLADPMLLDRTLENLIANAAKHTPAAAVVHVSAHEQADAIVVAVADNGPGIAPEDLPRLGERFFRGRPRSGVSVPGTGLGLAFVQAALGLHGSTLKIESSRRTGTVFSFTLPGVTIATPPRAVRQLNQAG